MTRLKMVGVVAAMMVALLVRTPAQVVDRAEILLQAARTKQHVESRPAEAIELYQQAMKQAGSNRTIAATALLGLAQSYEKLGRPEAQPTYRRVAQEYADVPVIAREARAKLTPSTARQSSTGGTAPRVVFEGDGIQFTDVSADGTFAIGLQGVGRARVLTQWTLASGQARTLASPSAGEVLTTARIAPSGREVAFRWARADGKPRNGFRVVAIGTGEVRDVPLASSDDWGLCAWSADSGSLLVTRFSGGIFVRALEWLAIADGRRTELKVFEEWMRADQSANVSADGAFVTYSIAPSPGSSDRHIFVIDADGRNDTAVMNSAGRSLFPKWLPEKSHLVFVSDRLGSNALWSVPMQNGRSAGEPSLLTPEVVRLITVTRGGQLFYETVVGAEQQAFLASVTPTGGKVSKAFTGEGLGYSPDGRSLAYIRNSAGPLAVIVRNLATGEEKAFERRGLGLPQVRWFADGAAVLVNVNELSDHSDTPLEGWWLYRLDLKTGEYQRFVPRMTEQGLRSGVVAIAPDAKTVYSARKINPASTEFDILAIDVATGAERKLTTLVSSGESNPGIAISPDGTRLVLQVWANQARREGRLAVVSTDGSATRELVATFPADRTQSILKWGSDNRILYFETAPNGDWRLMRIGADGGAAEPAGLDSTRLVADFKMPKLTTFSPLSFDATSDGRELAFASYAAPHNTLWVIDDVATMIRARQ